MNTWDEVEKQPEFGLLTPEDKETVHNEWQQGVLKTLTDEDPEKINSAGVHNFLATEQARRNSFKTGGLFDATQAQQGYAQSLKERSDAQSKALADYDAVEKNRFALKDAESARNAAMAMDTYVGEGAKTLDQNIALRKQELAAAENQLTPEQLKQAAEAKEAMEGKRPTAVLGSDLYTSPALLLDKDKYRQAVAQSDASPDAKARALADFTAKRSQYAKNALNTFRTAGESPIPGTTSFASWEAAQPEEVRKLSPEDKALEYMRTMEKRGEFSKLTSAIGIGALQGSTDIATQGLGVAAMATGSPKLAQKAAEVSEGANTLEEQAKLEGERASLAGRTAAGVTRQAIPMAAQVTGAALTGGASMPVAAGIAGLQTAGAQFPETYAELRKQGFSEEDAMRASRNAAALSGAITAGITAAFGKTGVESALRTGAGGKELVKNRLVAALKAIPKGAVSEIPEELLDEMATQVVEQRTIDPSKPVAQIVDDFAKTAPELALQVGLLGATGEGIGRFRKTTTKPGETAPAAPDTDFARRAALEGATEYNGPGEPVTVQGRVIAHVMPGAGLTPDQVAEYADEPDTLKALARANRIRLPEVAPPIEGVDTTEMDENIAASASLAPGTVDALRNLSPVTTGTETPVNAANVDGGSQSVQTEPAEGSIPAVTETKLPELETESSLENQPTAPNAPNPIEQQEGVRTEPAQGTPGEQTEEAGAGDSLRRAEEEQEVSPTIEWSPQASQEASFVLNGKSIIGTIESVRPDGNAVVRYSWDGKTEKTAVVPAAQLKRPIAALATAPWYEYNQEQNTRKAAKHGIPSKPGIYNNFNLQRVFDSMANDKSLSHIYRMIARVLASKSSLSNIKVGIWADGRRNFAGLYSNAGGTDPRIDLNLRHVGRGKVDLLGTLLHEALHHETLEKLKNPQTEEEREAAKAINELRQKISEYAKTQGKDTKYDYELGSDEEFVSALFTRPDFQDFLASIPADFAPRTGASKFRSVLSELFRQIAQLVTSQRVPKGSPMEQAMTATLALFETPYRPVVTESVNLPLSPAERGYRTPYDALTETAAKLRGEQTRAAPTGLQKMFNPQPGRPATGERRLFEMPKEQPRQVDLRTAYQRAQSGSGTGWVSIKDVYGQAKEADPDLTPEEFMAHINEQNDSGKIYVSPLETAAAVEAAKPFVVGAANAEMLMPQQVAMSPAESVPSEDLFRETRSRFAPTKPEDRMYRVQGDEEANRKVSDWINSVTPARAASLLLSNRTPGWMDGNMRTIALGNLIKGFTEIVSTSADEDEQTVARATAQDLGKLWVKEGQDPARSMRQRGVQNGTTLQPIAPILAAQQVLADRGEKVLKDQIVGGSEEAVPRIEAARERADEELENRLQKIVTRIMGGMQTIGTAKGAIARMFRGKGQRDQIVDEVGKALMLKARGNVVTPERRTALANLVSSLKSTLAKNVQGERIPAPKQTTQDLLTSAFVNQVAEGPLFEEAWAEGRQKVLDMLVDIEMDKKVAPAEKRVTDLTERLRHLDAGSDEQRKAAAAEIASLGRQIESELDLIRSEREAIKALMPQLEAQRDKLMPATPSMAFNPAASREAISRAFEQAGYTADVTTGLDKSGKRTLSVKDALLNRQRAVDAVMRVFDEAMQQADENTQREWPAARAAAVKAVNETLDTWQKQMDEDAAEKLAEKKESLLGEDSRALQKLVNSIRAKIAPGQDWSDVLSDLPQKQKDRLAEIKERVAKHEALQNLTADEADQLVKNIDKLWQKERLKAFQDELLRAGVIKAKTAKAEANVVSAAPELLRLMNLGVFSSSTFREAVSKRFGLKQMTNAQADYLKKLAVEAWNLPEGVLRNNKLKEVVDGLQHTTKATFSEIMSSYWVASVLSGLRTQFETWATLIVGAGANLTQAAGLLATGKGGAALQAHFQWWNALGGVMKNEVAYLLRTGDSSITKKYAEDIAKSLSGEKGSVFNALGERWWKEGNIAQKVPGLLMIAVGRSMMAADHVNNTATTQGAMAVARAMNPELYNGKSGYTQKEHEGARALALAQVTGGAEPANAKERALVSARTREILNENVQEEDRSEASEIGNISAFQNDPTGLFGMLYQMAKSMTSTGQRWFEKRAEDENSFALARAINAVGAGVIHAATGTRFMRFGFNMGNEYIRYMPGSWVLDKWIYPILEDTKTPMRSQLLIGKNLIGAMLFATVQAWLGDDDDEKDGVWHIEGDWADLSDADKESRMSAGFRPRSFWIRENGKMKTIFYTQWPLAGLMAAVGATHDERRYKPEKWKERGTFGHILHAAQVGLFQAQNSAALQRLAELFGKTDPNISDKKLNLPEKMAVNVVSGVTPTFIKDLDKWNDPRSYSPEGMWESMVREVPVARRYVNDGRPQFNRLGEDIKLHREPYSRLVLNQELSKPMEIYGKLLSRGLDFSSPSTDRKIVKDGKAVPMESFGRGVVYDFEKGVAQARREMLEKHGDKLTTMPISSAHKLLKDISRMIVDREAAKVQSAINKQSRK